MLCAFLRFKKRRVNLLSKVCTAHFVFLSQDTAECKSKVAGVRCTLLLLSTSAIGNSTFNDSIYQIYVVLPRLFFGS